jgi:hypothetical protein
MKCWLALFLLLIPSISRAQHDSTKFQSLYQSENLNVSAEKTLYETESSAHFFIHYQIKNTSQNEFEIYLKEYDQLFYPNQWGITDTMARMIVDERRIIPRLSDSIISRMVRLHHLSKLVILKPGETVDYYRDFNNGTKKDIKFKKGEYMYISMDGLLFYLFAGGIHEIGYAHFEDEKYTQSGTMYLPYPLTFKKIPANATIFNEN